MGSHTLLSSHVWWQIELGSCFRSSWRHSIWACGAHSLFGGSLSHYDLHDGWRACQRSLDLATLTEDILLALHLEDVVVRSAVVYDSSIEFPWPSKEKMTNGHWNNVALQGVFVGADLEGDLYSMLDLDGAGVS